MLRFIFLIATLLSALLSAASSVGSAQADGNSVDVDIIVGSSSGSTATIITSSFLRGAHRRLKDKKRNKVEEEDDDGDDDDDYAAATIITTTEKQHEQQQEKETAKEAQHPHTTKATTQQETSTNQEEQEEQPTTTIPIMEGGDIVEELDEVMDEINALDLNNTNGKNEEQIEELEEEEYELIEEIMEEEGGLYYDDDDEFEYNNDNEVDRSINDDTVNKEIGLAEEIGEMKETIDEIENEDDDGNAASVSAKEAYVEGLKGSEEELVKEIVMKASEGGKNSSMIVDKIHEIEMIEEVVVEAEEDDDDDGAWEEGKKEVEEGFQIIENACEFLSCYICHCSLILFLHIGFSQELIC